MLYADVRYRLTRAKKWRCAAKQAVGSGASAKKLFESEEERDADIIQPSISEREKLNHIVELLGRAEACNLDTTADITRLLRWLEVNITFSNSYNSPDRNEYQFKLKAFKRIQEVSSNVSCKLEIDEYQEIAWFD